MVAVPPNTKAFCASVPLNASGSIKYCIHRTAIQQRHPTVRVQSFAIRRLENVRRSRRPTAR
eukprot:552325-Prorocentrum_minimum.AAC.1